MLPDRVSNPGPLTYESGALPIALRGPALQGRGGKDAGKHLLNSNCLYILSFLKLLYKAELPQSFQAVPLLCLFMFSCRSSQSRVLVELSLG